ncbi:MAG: DUF3299 domain-containing protein [Bacteroidota bacterium]
MVRYLVVLGILFPTFMWGQKSVRWETLANVTYSYVQNFEQNFWYGTPTFAEEVLALDGQEIIIKGYAIPGDINGDVYYLSAFPFSECFFCGGAGQESIMELRLKNKKTTFTVDQYVTLKGTLKLNDRELELNYILEDARVQ